MMISKHTVSLKALRTAFNKAVAVLLMVTLTLAHAATDTAASSSTGASSSSTASSSSGGFNIITKICPDLGCMTKEGKAQYAKQNRCKFLEDICSKGSQAGDLGPTTDDSGFWGSLWNDVKTGLQYGYQFVKGLVEGLADQVTGLIDAVFHIGDALTGLYELGKQFYNDPAGTLKKLGEILGQEVLDTITQATQCGAYDTGRVIGQNISPVLVTKLATKLGKFKSLIKAIKDTKLELGCASFAAGTRIFTQDNQGAPTTQAVETMAIGNTVQSRNDKTYLDAPQRVNNTFSRIAPRYYLLETEFDSLKVTEEHPLWLQGHGWTKVKDLKRGDVVATQTGDVTILQNTLVEQPIKVYNFTVENTPSYFVGHGLWVHNAKCPIPSNVFAYGEKATYLLAKKWRNAAGELLWLNPVTNKLEVLAKDAAVHIDHIFPQKAIKEIDSVGWDKLPKEVQNKLLNDPDNLQPMIGKANCSKGCKVEGSLNEWKTWTVDGVTKNIDPIYKKELQMQQDTMRQKVLDAIKANQ